MNLRAIEFFPINMHVDQPALPLATEGPFLLEKTSPREYGGQIFIRRAPSMTIESELLERASGRCELCSATSELEPYDVTPNKGPSTETHVLLCATCRDHVSKPASLDHKHWYGLNESIWSEHDAVKVLAWRVLKGLGDNSWAQDLLGQMYLDDEQQSWAEAGLKTETDEAKPQVVDSNGTVLNEGDTVTLIKDLEVKGANFTAKRGTTVKNISLTDDPKFIEGRVNGMRIVLVAAYLKKA
jgi:protein PhnA